MKQRASFFVILLCLMWSAAFARATEFKSVGAQPAVLYDAPSYYYGHKVFIAPSGMPVEVILTQDSWSKIRDASKDLSWIEASALTAKRNVVVTVASAGLHLNADEHSPLLATIEQGVWLTLISPAAPDWLKVMHRDGEIGFIKTGDVWGD